MSPAISLYAITDRPQLLAYSDSPSFLYPSAIVGKAGIVVPENAYPAADSRHRESLGDDLSIQWNQAIHSLTLQNRHASRYQPISLETIKQSLLSQSPIATEGYFELIDTSGNRLWYDRLYATQWLGRTFPLEVAHRLPQVPVGHPCGRLHGHSMSVTLWQKMPTEVLFSEAEEQLNQIGKTIITPLYDSYLNDIAGLENPTSEHLTQWLWQNWQTHKPAQATAVSATETKTSGCYYDGTHHTIWKEFSFEAACPLPASKQINDNPRRIQGHSYRLRLVISQPLDPVMGWVMDYGEIKQKFSSLYRQLDHHILNDLTGTQQPFSLQSLAAYLFSQLPGVGLPVVSLILLQTSESGVLVGESENIATCSLL